MGLVSIVMIAISLAMDAFAVSIANGVSVKHFSLKDATKQGLYFGGFQFAMPMIGWILGTSVKDNIEAVDHWIAFGLLLVIGVNMIVGSLQKDGSNETDSEAISVKTLLLQAVATSIDALAVGISFALLDVNILWASIVIGVVAFVAAVIGGLLGNSLGGFLGKKAEFAGGVVLILIGLKILLEQTVFMR